MDWNTLISAKRFGLEEFHKERHENRSEFQRDYDRLIFSAPFRRLQNKTQVFPLPGSIFVHNRLTHSLEVSCVGRSLGNDVAKPSLSAVPTCKAPTCRKSALSFPPPASPMIWEIHPSATPANAPSPPSFRKERAWH